MSGDDKQEKAEDFSLNLSENLLAAAVEAVEKRMGKEGDDEDGETLDVELTESEGDDEVDIDIDIDAEDSLDLEAAVSAAATSAETFEEEEDEDVEDVEDEDSEHLVDAERLQMLAQLESLEAGRDSAVAALEHKEKEVEHLRSVAEKLQAEIGRVKELNLKMSVRRKRMKEGYERQRIRHEDALATVRKWEELLGAARGTIRAQEDEQHRTRLRHQREIEETKIFGNEGFFRELLPVLDHMDLALAHADDTPPQKMVEGVNMIYAQLKGMLHRMGLQKVDPKRGDPFDPKVHEAMTHLVCEDLEAGAVVEALQTGFLLRDRLIRAARVSVSSGTGLDEEPVVLQGEVSDTDVEAHANEE